MEIFFRGFCASLMFYSLSDINFMCNNANENYEITILFTRAHTDFNKIVFFEFFRELL